MRGTCWNMYYSHSTVCLVYMLPSCTTGPKRFNSEVIGINSYVHLLITILRNFTNYGNLLWCYISQIKVLNFFFFYLCNHVKNIMCIYVNVDPTVMPSDLLGFLNNIILKLCLHIAFKNCSLLHFSNECLKIFPL